LFVNTQKYSRFYEKPTACDGLINQNDYICHIIDLTDYQVQQQ